MPNTRWELGGNAPVMANRFASEGFQVFLGAKATKYTEKNLHPAVKGMLRYKLYVDLQV
jgi:hypothetical protein